MLLAGLLAACNGNKNENDNKNDNAMIQELTLTQEWDKTFPLSDKVEHRKVTFETHRLQSIGKAGLREIES